MDRKSYWSTETQSVDLTIRTMQWVKYLGKYLKSDFKIAEIETCGIKSCAQVIGFQDTDQLLEYIGYLPLFYFLDYRLLIWVCITH